MLRVLHPLDESRSALVMISEPLTASLANAFGDTRRPREYEKEVDAKKEAIDFDRLVAQHELGALDVKNGLRQVSHTLMQSQRRISDHGHPISTQPRWQQVIRFHHTAKIRIESKAISILDGVEDQCSK